MRISSMYRCKLLIVSCPVGSSVKISTVSTKLYTLLYGHFIRARSFCGVDEIIRFCCLILFDCWCSGISLPKIRLRH